MTDQQIQDIAEAELLKNIKLWFESSSALLQKLSDLPLSNSSKDHMNDLILGLSDLEPNYKSIEEDFCLERERNKDLLDHPRHE